MILYTTVGTNDLPRSVGFYDALFREMGLEQCFLDDTSASWGRKDDETVSRFSVGYPLKGYSTAGNGTMTAFRIDEPARVDRLHEIALTGGGSDDGAPGYRAHYSGAPYAAYIRDPDGNKLAFICYGSPEL
jgi:catechol 2,3-dioxygenase-like lactoylglutathione lyase family enzyme